MARTNIDIPSSRPSGLILNPREAASYLQSTPSTLADWRLKGIGPRWAKAGRRVLYRQTWLDEWLDARSVSSTAEAKRLGL